MCFITTAPLLPLGRRGGGGRFCSSLYTPLYYLIYLKIPHITSEIKREVKEESNQRRRKASGRNLQVEEGMEREEERQVDLGDEVHRGNRCRIGEHGGGNLSLCLCWAQVK